MKLPIKLFFYFIIIAQFLVGRMVSMELSFKETNKQLAEINKNLLILINKQQPITLNVNQESNNVLHAQQFSWNQAVAQIPNMQTVQQTIGSFLRTHKYKIIIAALVASYVGLISMIIQGNSYLKNNNTWATWKYHLTPEELLTMDQKLLAHDLIKSIQEHYYTIKNPTDCITPLVRFAHEIEKEIRIVNHYITVGNAIKRCHLISLFPLSHDSLNQALHQLQRLHAIKHIFSSWATMHSYEQLGIQITA